MPDISKSHTEFLNRLTEIIEANLENEQFGVSELAGEMGMSRSNLHRKVHVVAKLSVSQFIRQVRLKHAMNMLRQTSFTVSEVSWKTGFGSISYFIKCFREYYGFPPGEVGTRDNEHIILLNRESKNTKKKNTWILVIGLPAIALSVILFLLLFPMSEQEEKSKITIAVLPLLNDSMDSTITHKINGLMGGIIDNLSNNPNLIVRSRTTTEKYRGSTLSTPEIARELKVKHTIGANVQSFDSMIIINVQLTDARSDENIKSWPFRKKVNKVADIDDLLEEIVTAITSELNAEIQHINFYNNLSADNIQALYLFWKGQELGRSAFLYNDAKLGLQAKEKFELALKVDSGFVPPMVQLGWICVGRGMRNFADRALYQDSAFYYARRAIKFDNESAGAYHLLGRLYHITGNYEKALETYKIAQKYNENEPAQNLALLYFEMGKYKKSIDLLYKHLKFQRET